MAPMSKDNVVPLRLLMILLLLQPSIRITYAISLQIMLSLS